MSEVTAGEMFGGRGVTGGPVGVDVGEGRRRAGRDEGAVRPHTGRGGVARPRGTGTRHGRLVDCLTVVTPTDDARGQRLAPGCRGGQGGRLVGGQVGGLGGVGRTVRQGGLYVKR